MFQTCLLAFAALAGVPELGQGLGVNIHFTGAPARDLDLIAAAGFGWVRMDFSWAAVERRAGEYEFGPYDALVEGLAARGLRAIFILDYSNPLHERDRSVRTEDGRRAFARFAGEAARRYRGRGLRWELWNEPNLEQFWKPQPSADDYAALVRAAAPAIRAADPDAVVVAPASSGFPWEFLERIFELGVLADLDEVSVHPYRSQPPETVVADYRRLRALIARRLPPGKATPALLSGEWGYSNTHWGTTIAPERQGAYLARQFLTNIAEGIALSIWYDWANDGPDPKETEHNFGTVTLDRRPKPAYEAARALTETLGASRFRRRLAEGPEHLLVFREEATGRSVIAAWSERDEESALHLEVGQAREPRDEGGDGVVTTTVVDMLGRTTTVAIVHRTIHLRVGPEPRYLRLPVGIDPDALALNVIECLPLSGQLRVRVSRLGPGERKARAVIRVGASRTERPLVATASAPIDIEVPAAWSADRPLDVQASLLDDEGGVIASAPPRAYGAALRLLGDEGPGGAPALLAVLDGNRDVAATVDVSAVAAEGAPRGLSREVLRLRYRWAPGWRFVRLTPSSGGRAEGDARIPGRPLALSVWVKGDGSGNALRCRVRDASGEIFQPSAGVVTWSDWRCVTLTLGEGAAGHWGGNNDGRMDGPLSWDSLLLLDSTGEVNEGELLFSDPLLVYSIGAGDPASAGADDDDVDKAGARER